MVSFRSALVASAAVAVCLAVLGESITDAPRRPDALYCGDTAECGNIDIVGYCVVMREDTGYGECRPNSYGNYYCTCGADAELEKCGDLKCVDALGSSSVSCGAGGYCEGPAAEGRGPVPCLCPWQPLPAR